MISVICIIHHGIKYAGAEEYKAPFLCKAAASTPAVPVVMKLATSVAGSALSQHSTM
jgi:hypothetical protein